MPRWGLRFRTSADGGGTSIVMQMGATELRSHPDISKPVRPRSKLSWARYNELAIVRIGNCQRFRSRTPLLGNAATCKIGRSDLCDEGSLIQGCGHPPKPLPEAEHVSRYIVHRTPHLTAPRPTLSPLRLRHRGCTAATTALCVRCTRLCPRSRWALVRSVSSPPVTTFRPPSPMHHAAA